MGKTITAGFIGDTINGIGINSSIKCNNDNLNNNTKVYTVGLMQQM